MQDARGPSVLLEDVHATSTATEPAGYLEDLHLDEVIASITAPYEPYALDAFFRQPLVEPDAVAYRQEVFRDLERSEVLGTVRTFAKAMSLVRELLRRSARVDYRYEQERWFLDAAAAYAEAVGNLAGSLEQVQPRSRGLRAIGGFVAGLVDGPAFRALRGDIDQLRAQLSSVLYTIEVDGGRVVVARFAMEPDYGTEVARAFDRFQQGEGREFRFSISPSQDMNHVEAAILDRVALLYPAVFASLDTFRAVHEAFPDDTILRFDREIHFYLAYLDHIGRIRGGNLSYCYPQIAGGDDPIEARGVFDIALAPGLLRERMAIVPNDFELRAGERLIVVSGPNQGGKTTFGRTFGQVHHLARIGVPVPGSAARLPLVDAIYTHFEREERVEDLAGKLEEDLIRIREILQSATAESVVVMNESFNSTTLADQLLINTGVVRALVERGCIGVVVTFLDELASMDPSIVSMVSTVDPAEPANRTFRIVRRAADGLAYAMSIAEKHGLTRARVAKRIAR